ncbi:alcohol dehydrogenase [Hyaloraphidium curvatum]|nr:alcohol dehydrogenase [Hyaloraphidium curvatum]
MQAVRLHGPRDVRLDTDVPDPGPPGPGQVLVAPRRVGICGSDIHIWKSDYGEIPASAMPFRMGHEASGVVQAVGEGVEGFAVGDRVAVEPMSMDLLAERFLIPATRLHKMADSVSFEEGAMCEPLAVSYRAVNLAGVKEGDNVLVIGAGPIGLLALVAAKARKPARVVVADVKQGRLETAEKFGADGLADTAGLEPAEAAGKCAAAFDGKPIDVVIDAAGHASTVDAACIAVKPRGVVVLVGIATIKGEFNYMRLVQKEVDLRGSFAYRDRDYADSLALMAEGKVDIKALASHVVDMADAQKAYGWCEKGEDDEGKAVLKVVFRVSD